MHHLAGRWAVRRPWVVCLAWAAVAAGLTLVGPPRPVADPPDLPATSASARGYDLLHRAFPRDAFASRAVVTIERPDGPLSAGDFALADRIAAELDDLRREPQLGIGTIDAHRDGLTSADGQATLIRVSLDHAMQAPRTSEAVGRIEAIVRQALATAGSAAPRVSVSGPAVVARAAGPALHPSTVTWVLLVAPALLLVRRSPALVLVQFTTVGVSVWSALRLAALVAGTSDIGSLLTVITVVVVGTGSVLALAGRY